MKRNNHGRYVSIIILIGFLSALCISDTLHQRKYEDVRLGYGALRTGSYEDAAERFTTYISAHKSDLYWKCVETVNGKENCLTKSNVEKALEESLSHLSE